MKTITITITGAAGNIAYSLIFRILSGNIFNQDDKIRLNLLDIPSALQVLKGVKLEVEDCAFKQLDSVLITDNPEKAFSDSDFILLVGAKPRSKGMQRADLLLDNASIFQKQAIIINEVAKKTSKIIVVGNPANTNALIVQHFAKNIPDENITSLMRLDQNRAKSILSNKLKQTVDSISRLIVWGNHSATQYPDLTNTLISGDDSLVKKIDMTWISEVFIPRVQKRGAEIIEHRGKSSAASAASAIYDHLNALVNSSNDWESMGVMRSNDYDISNEIFFSYPLIIENSIISINNDLKLTDDSFKFIKESEAELLTERNIIRSILKD